MDGGKGAAVVHKHTVHTALLKVRALHSLHLCLETVILQYHTGVVPTAMISQHTLQLDFLRWGFLTRNTCSTGLLR